MLFQTCINFFLVLNSNTGILKNVGNKQLLVPFNFDSRKKNTMEVTGEQQLFGYTHSTK